jgi:hypothetical protein
MNEEMMKYDGGQTALTGRGAGVEIAASREMAEVQAAVVMARRFPRDEMRAIEKIKNACSRPSLAESAVYQYSRGGSDVSGPSIRLAEALAANWGNIQCGVREVEQRNGESTCEAFAWDMESNFRVVKSFKVSHIRHTRRGDTVLTDPRDIYEMVANQGARRVRSCILGIIPGDVVEDAVRQCETTLNAKADTTPEGLKKVADAFAAYGVTVKQLEARIQRRWDSITAAQVVGLRKIIVSLRDGMSKPEDWFDPIAKAVPSEIAKPKKLRDALKPAASPELEPAAVQEAAAEDDDKADALSDELPL